MGHSGRLLSPPSLAPLLHEAQLLHIWEAELRRDSELRWMDEPEELDSLLVL